MQSSDLTAGKNKLSHILTNLHKGKLKIAALVADKTSPCYQQHFNEIKVFKFSFTSFYSHILL